MRKLFFLCVFMLVLFAVTACSRYKSSGEAAAFLEGQFVRYGSYTSGSCSYEFKQFALSNGAVDYSIERLCTHPSIEGSSRSVFTYHVKLDDLEPDAPTGKIDDQGGDAMFFAGCKRDVHCVEIVERYENNPRGAEGRSDSQYVTIMFRLSPDIPEKELRELGKVFRRMMALEAKGR